MADIDRASPGDAGEILTLQRAAYVTEAQMYGDPFIAPLVESLEQLRKVIETGVVLKAVEGARIVGSVRGRLPSRALDGGADAGMGRGMDRGMGGGARRGSARRPGHEPGAPGPACVVGRLVVAPDRQGNGIGTALLEALHAAVPEAAAFDLFTGHLSEGNLRLYRRLGYRETRRERVQDHLTLIHLRREVAPA
ncbi:GNAT family N-acetyltransferase [Microtetraspora sp. NBRC 16547]|uniref:GNAT family N-acetyltransferase n=1 Tax=Microtetraspora sp. NBRC 16547 TaxID=3030993 RepID=UPI0024A1DC41|nr:GNAT family N-acetyltransferase [Microtetraspora sp. NBRC 16547]GLW97393.1 GCN5 family acetyltransferase [Microtetraspora sp. NBRC 16547]